MITNLLLIFSIGLLSLSGEVQAQKALTLDKALEFAEQNSPDMQKSLFNLERFQQNLKAQKLALKSRFSLTLNPVEYSNNRRFDNRLSQWYTNESFSTSGTFRVDQPILPTDGTLSLINRFSWQDNSSKVGGQDNGNKAFSNNLYLSLNQPLFTYNKRKIELKSLELDLENANIGYAMQRLNLEKSVTEQFYNVYMAQMNLDIANEELENARANYEIIKNKVDAGLSAKEELYQAELNYANAKSTVQNRQVSMENTKDAFKNYIGMDILEEIVVLTDVSVDKVRIDLSEAIASGLRSRMEIRQREIDMETSQFDLIKVKAMNEFKGEVNLSIGITGDNEKLADIYENPTRNPKVSLSFNVPIFDWGEKKARLKAQEASMKSRQLDFDQQKTKIVIDIRRVYRDIQNQLIQIDIAKQSVRNAELTYEINKEKYQNGDLTGMQLNQYQNQLSQKKIAYSQALINYKIQLLNMKVQTLYDYTEQKAIVPQELYMYEVK
ncbi:TolC family protein [Prolixibacteraceae bacterium JC049]|nr:TolC family protein [Prolixibacteraceae bacterium JC049]